MDLALLRQRYVKGHVQATLVYIELLAADSGWRNTTISVNGGSAVRVDQPNTGGGGVVLSVPVKIFLRSGVNSVTIGAGQSSEFSQLRRPTLLISPIAADYAADLDKIVVYTDA